MGKEKKSKRASSRSTVGFEVDVRGRGRVRGRRSRFAVDVVPLQPRRHLPQHARRIPVDDPSRGVGPAHSAPAAPPAPRDEIARPRDSLIIRNLAIGVTRGPPIDPRSLNSMPSSPLAP